VTHDVLDIICNSCRVCKTRLNAHRLFGSVCMYNFLQNIKHSNEGDGSVTYSPQATCRNSLVSSSNTLQHIATRCKTLQNTPTSHSLQFPRHLDAQITLQHTATHCNAPHNTATHCNTLQHTATDYNTLQLTAKHCNSL